MISIKKYTLVLIFSKAFQKFVCPYIQGRGPYKKRFQNWQLDVSLLENFRKKGVSFSPFFRNFSKIVLIFTYTPLPFFCILFLHLCLFFAFLPFFCLNFEVDDAKKRQGGVYNLFSNNSRENQNVF